MKKQDRLTVVRAFSKEYQRVPKKQKSILLERLIKTTNYSRKHLMEILRNPPRTKRIRRRRVSKYFPVIKHLRKLWAVSNYACGQRLAPMIPDYLCCTQTA